MTCVYCFVICNSVTMAAVWRVWPTYRRHDGLFSCHITEKGAVAGDVRIQ